jgi:hypothetical protein
MVTDVLEPAFLSRFQTLAPDQNPLSAVLGNEEFVRPAVASV